MAKLGSLEWIEKTHGNLRLRDKLFLTAQGFMARAATKRRMKNNVKFRHLEVEDILPPDSSIAREAMIIAEEESEPFLFYHCLRAYFWARLLSDGTRPFDDEAVFTALMLHDMGLTEKHRLSGPSEQCFTIVGANMLQDLAQKHDWTDSRANVAANAITLHLNVTIQDAHGHEAEMVRMGSGADVAGLELDVLYADQIQDVCTKYPRNDFKPCILHTLRIEASERSASRIGFLNDRLGFERLVSGTRVFGD